MVSVQELVGKISMVVVQEMAGNDHDVVGSTSEI
jgi:hypothetical protein